MMRYLSSLRCFSAHQGHPRHQLNLSLVVTLTIPPRHSTASSSRLSAADPLAVSPI